MKSLHLWLPLCLMCCHLGDDGVIDGNDSTDSGEDGSATDDTDSTGDTGSNDTGEQDTGESKPALYDIADIEQAHAGPQDLGGFTFYAFVTVYVTNETSCPTKTEVGDGIWKLSGNGCTDSNGTTFTGEVELDFSPDGWDIYRFSNWSQHNSQSPTILTTVDGDLTLHSNGEGVWDASFEILRESWMGSTTYQFTDFTYSSVTELSNLYNGQGGTVTASGQVEVNGMDSFSTSMSVTENSNCDAEFDSMSLTMVGASETLTYTESASDCDGCTDWSSETRSGQICD